MRVWHRLTRPALTWIKWDLESREPVFGLSHETTRTGASDRLIFRGRAQVAVDVGAAVHVRGAEDDIGPRDRQAAYHRDGLAPPSLDG